MTNIIAISHSREKFRVTINSLKVLVIQGIGKGQEMEYSDWVILIAKVSQPFSFPTLEVRNLPNKEVDYTLFYHRILISDYTNRAVIINKDAKVFVTHGINNINEFITFKEWVDSTCLNFDSSYFMSTVPMICNSPERIAYRERLKEEWFKSHEDKRSEFVKMFDSEQAEGLTLAKEYDNFINGIETDFICNFCNKDESECDKDHGDEMRDLQREHHNRYRL
jgi:hypothetical protein